VDQVQRRSRLEARDTSSSGNYTVSTYQFSSNNTTARTINLNGSTVNISFPSSVALNLATTTNLTFNAGTSQINLTGINTGIASGGLTFWNVAFTNSTGAVSITITGANTFNILSFVGRTQAGISIATFNANQTIGTLTLNAGLYSAYRTFLASDTIETTRTLAVTTLTAGAADYDFRDIAITGSAAPLTGTRFGDCKGNSGITFPAGKTVYYRSSGSTNWGITGSTAWSLTNGGSLDLAAFPLAQDTAVFPSSPTPYPSSGVLSTLNHSYNIGTIDMSLRTTNTMTLATSTNTPTIYGNWINGTGITLTGTGQITFAGRGSQTITSAGKTFTQGITVNTPGGSVTLQDALIISRSISSAFTLTRGTFDAAIYNVTLSAAASGAFVSGAAVKQLNIGSGVWTIAGSGNAWNASISTNFTVTGTGTISLTSASSKSFIGGGIQTYPTLNQGGTGTLTVTGSNRFAAITATTAGTVSLTSGTTNQVPLINTTGTATVTVNPTSTTATIRGSVRSSQAAITGPLVLGAS
jgi:fibronectin-binding autotransporter adhesin